MPTETECVERERAAWVAGVEHMIDKGQLVGDFWPPFPQQAMSRYPLPTVTRPRVVGDPHDSDYRYCIIDGRVAVSHRGYPWGPVAMIPTTKRVALWANLLANPTEEVPADD